MDKRQAWIIASLFGNLSTLSLFMENAILQVESEHTNQLDIASVVDTLKIRPFSFSSITAIFAVTFLLKSIFITCMLCKNNNVVLANDVYSSSI